ncbi:MAG: hypothetical protein WCH97_05950, partial [Actinomycetes bacterium]
MLNESLVLKFSGFGVFLSVAGLFSAVYGFFAKSAFETHGLAVEGNTMWQQTRWWAIGIACLILCITVALWDLRQSRDLAGANVARLMAWIVLAVGLAAEFHYEVDLGMAWTWIFYGMVSL